MPEIDPVILELRVRDENYRGKLRDAERIVDQSFGRQERRVRQLENEMRRSSGAIGNTFKRMAAALGTAFTGRELVGLIDSFTRFQNQLRVAGLEGEKLAEVQERLRAIGATYGVELEALGSTFNRASLAQKELGASTEDIIRLNEIVAAGLKVAGTSSQQASGALLQLAQALGSGVVRAEEFNSILEGALPVAQAAARGIDGMGGSVAKLRAEVAAGNVTSQQFFQGILKGGVATIEQAESATLTLSGAFTVLRNELTLYFGDAAKTSGATKALAEAIKSLADNLDTIIPALTIIATLMTGRFLAGANGGGRAMQALAAHVSVATTSLAGLRLAAGSAIGSLFSALGGIPGIAISAALAIGYVVTQTETAEEATARLRGETEALEQQADAMERRLREAGVEIVGLGDGADAASDQFHNFWDVIGGTIGRLKDLARQSGITRAALIGTQIEELQAEKDRLNRAGLTVQRQALAGTAMAGGASALDPLPGGSDPHGTVDQRRQAELDRQIAALKRQQRAVIAAGLAGVDLEGSGGGTAPAAGSHASSTSSRAAPTGPSKAEQLDRQYNALLRQIELEGRLAAMRDEGTAEAQKQADILEAQARIAEQFPELDEKRLKFAQDFAAAQIEAAYARKAATEELDAWFDAAEKRHRALTEMRERAEADLARRQGQQIRTLASIYQDAFHGGTEAIWRDFKDIGLAVIAELLARFTLAQFGGKAFNFGDALGAALGSVLPGFGGGRAVGGPVNPGTAYLVGERGPELLVPRAPGFVVPNQQLQAAGQSGGTVRLVIEEAPGFAARVRAEATGVAIDVQRQAAPVVIEAAANETIRRVGRLRL